ncbi:MAG: cytochrome c oxidase assembly protein [Candidatus Rokubacteria bacterium]|nr:cytochrome c oxidase assembly protein [Candidatus Rokubacteria bacterium]
MRGVRLAHPRFQMTIHLDVVIGVGVLAGAWAGAWATRGARPRGAEIAALALALVALLGMLNGPMHDLSDRVLFSAHMAQHLVLTLVVPPLVLLAVPGWMIDGLLRAARLDTLVRALTRPVPALALYTIALVTWHLPAAYTRALEVHGWHIVQHLTLMAAATLAWWPVLGRSSLAPRLPYAAQILHLFAFGMPMTAVAAMITGSEALLYPFYAEAPRLVGLTPFDDQRLGGVLMWVPAAVVPLIAFTAVFFRWVAAERDEDVAVRDPDERPALR